MIQINNIHKLEGKQIHIQDPYDPHLCYTILATSAKIAENGEYSMYKIHTQISTSTVIHRYMCECTPKKDCLQIQVYDRIIGNRTFEIPIDHLNDPQSFLTNLGYKLIIPKHFK